MGRSCLYEGNSRTRRAFSSRRGKPPSVLDFVTTYAGAFTGLPATDGGPKSGLGRYVDSSQNKASAPISPGLGAGADLSDREDLDRGGSSSRARRDPNAMDIGFPVHGPLTLQATHARVLAHEPPEEWPTHLTTTYDAATPQTEDLDKVLRSARSQKARSRQEQERRWQRWQERELRKKHKAGSQAAPSEYTDGSASLMPAGQRRAKGIKEHYSGGVRLPLFGEDVPKPQWAGLLRTPWATREPEEAAPQAERQATPRQAGAQPALCQVTPRRTDAALRQAPIEEHFPLPQKTLPELCEAWSNVTNGDARASHGRATGSLAQGRGNLKLLASAQKGDALRPPPALNAADA